MTSSHVQVTARYPLHCANNEVLSQLESPFPLGPLDAIVFATVPIETVFIYRKPSLANELIPIERLRQALSHVLDYYPHLTGRLQFNASSQAPEMTRLGAGAELLEARYDRELGGLIPPDRVSGRLLLTDLPDCGSALMPKFDFTLEGVCCDPILAIQHTRFACGSVALGIRVHHIVCDACGFFQLVRDLAELYRGLSSSSSSSSSSQPCLSRLPVIRSYLHDLTILSPEERQKAREYQPAAFYAEPAPAAGDPKLSREELAKAGPSEVDGFKKPPVIGRVLRFSRDDLKALKQMASEPGGSSWVSTFEALCAYLCQKVYRARVQFLMAQGMSEADAAKSLSPGFWASMNMRDPHRLNLPERYFPNAIYPPYNTFTHELIADSPLWKVAKALHDLIRGVDVLQMDQTARWLAEQPDKSRIRVRYTFADGNFTVSQWSGFGMYVGVEFDSDEQGRSIAPVLVAPPFTDISRVDGLAMILSTEEELYAGAGVNKLDAGTYALDVNLTFSQPLWAIMDEDEQFRKYCS